VLLVIDAGRTRRVPAQQAIESLRQVKANVLGAVLNGVPQRRGGYYYYYRYDRDGRKQGKRKRRSRAGKWRLPARRQTAGRAVPPGAEPHTTEPPGAVPDRAAPEPPAPERDRTQPSASPARRSPS
jgi:Mrp family chromosome partitioning ATPase